MTLVEQKITTAQAWRTARIGSGLSVSELATKARIGRRTIERIEAGTITRPRMGTVRAASKALRRSPSDLLPEQVSP